MKTMFISRSLRRSSALYGVCLCLASSAVQAAEPWGPNLWPNSTFSDGIEAWSTWAPPNQTALPLTTGPGCAGTHALRLPNEPENNYQAHSPRLRLEPGWHLLSFWYRIDREAETAPLQLLYVNLMTGDDAARRRKALYFYYGAHAPTDTWRLAFLMFRLREGDTGLSLSFAAGGANRALDVDLIQVRRLTPPDGPGEITSRHRTAYGTARIDDPEAPDGFAFRVAEGQQTRGTKTGGGPRFENPPGLYRVTFTFRQEQPAERDRALGVRLGADSGSTMAYLFPSDFEDDDGYRQFEFYSLYPFGTGTFPAWGWEGRGAYRFAGAVYERLLPMTQRQGWDLLAPGIDLDAVLPVGDPLPGDVRAWVGWGLYTEMTGWPAALEATGRPYARSLAGTRHGRLTIAPPMPALDGLDTVILANVPARSLAPAEQLALQRFVEQGGTLVVSGGFYSFGPGGFPGSFLEEILPVQLLRTFDLTRVAARLTLGDGDPATVAGGCDWVHAVDLKPDAVVRARADDHPALVVGTVGRGTVIAVPATVLGTPAEPFWTSPEWTGLLREVLQYGRE